MELNNYETNRSEIVENGLVIGIDWLSFTLPPDESLSVADTSFLLGFHPDDFTMSSKGANGYRTMHILSGANLRILSNGNKEMGIHVDVSGSAISTLLSAWRKKITHSTPFGTDAVSLPDFTYTVLLDLLDTLFKMHASFTRIDLSIDDIGCHYYSCDDVLRLIENKQLISKFRKCNVHYSRLLSNGTKQGDTIYLGSRQSEIMLRIYNKSLEMEHKHNTHFPYKWVRWEVELKKDRANQAVKRLLETLNISQIALGILKNYVRFIVHDSPNRFTCSTDSTWDSFLNNLDGVSLYIPDTPKTIEDTKKWIDKYVGASICAIVEADGGSFDYFYNHMEKWHKKRIQSRDLTNRLMQALTKREENSI